MGILLGLTAALCWGVGDFFATAATRRVGATRALLFTQSFSLLAIALLVVAQGEMPAVSAAIWWQAFAFGLLNFAATQLLFRAFQIGTLSLVSPLASSYTIVTAILAMSFGERPTAPALLGALLLLPGVVFLTASPTAEAGANRVASNQNAAQQRGLLEAGGAALCFGLVFWGMGRSAGALGLFWPLLIFRVVTLSGVGAQELFVAIRHARRENAWRLAPETSAFNALSGWPLWALAMIVAACDTGAWLSFGAGTRAEWTTIVTALTSLFGGVTVLLACWLLHEHLSRRQWTGILIILLGIVLVSAR